MQAVTLEIILRAVFGLGEGERLERLRRELRALLDKLTNPRMLLLPLLLGPERLARFSSFRHAMARVDRPIYDEIGERRAAGDLDERSDVLSLLLQARHENGEAMTDREVRDELVTLLVAGHETTATALAWAVERLARHPDKLERLAEEVRAGATGYLDAVVAETLRLRPVISLVARRLTKPVEIGGWSLPAGVTVTPSIYLLHRRADLYREPERFLPERFLDEPPGTTPGSRSVAASDAVWAARSRSPRCARCSASLSGADRSDPRARDPRPRSDARSRRRRATTPR